jgi:hypothetical protein
MLVPMQGSPHMMMMMMPRGAAGPQGHGQPRGPVMVPRGAAPPQHAQMGPGPSGQNTTE